MNETEFLALAAGVLDRLESQADDWFSVNDVDVDASRSGNVLTLAFDSGVQVIVNSQAPMQELWVAAPSGGFHYRYDGQVWHDTRGGPPLHEALSQIVSAAAGQPLTVTV
ncbi:Frataxin homolog CyaY, facilitates iron supply for heme A synthesis or Fe-S cluster assembly [plant metagenome]|uniref:Frataxin homolog CyaY, facilitates iron supply for heme A synthesis or Fe-S cluster assembly n=1 Tax=plant metagenome TaxID=1297885 RepID=A0A484PG94_9ZZZZ